MKKMKLSNLLKEDVNVYELHPDLIGFYAFLQALNRVGNEAPVPMPVIDIIPNHSLKENPGPFSFSKNSFKIQLNPSVGELNFNGEGHDVFHAITVNMAKHFARKRDLKGQGFNFTNSKFNLKKNVEPFLMKQLQNDENLPPLEKDQANAKSHFQKQLKLRKGNDKLSLSNIFHHNNIPPFSQYFDEEDKISDEALADLPQYDVEEDFGNQLAFALEPYIISNKPINFKNVWTRVTQNTMEDFVSTAEFFGSVEESRVREAMIVKMIKVQMPFVTKLAQTYNQLLKRYLSAKHK